MPNVCIFFPTKQGCWHADACRYKHDLFLLAKSENDTHHKIDTSNEQPTASIEPTTYKNVESTNLKLKLPCFDIMTTDMCSRDNCPFTHNVSEIEKQMQDPEMQGRLVFYQRNKAKLCHEYVPHTSTRICWNHLQGKCQEECPKYRIHLSIKEQNKTDCPIEMMNGLCKNFECACVHQKVYNPKANKW